MRVLEMWGVKREGQLKSIPAGKNAKAQQTKPPHLGRDLYPAAGFSGWGYRGSYPVLKGKTGPMDRMLIKKS